MKNIIKKTPPRDLEVALMSYRKTPINASIPSPHHLMFHQSNEQNARQHENLLLKQDTTMKRESTGRRKVESTLKKEDNIYVGHPIEHTWSPATIANKRVELNSFDIITPHGNTIRRTRHHIRHHISNNDTNPSPSPIGNLIPDIERDESADREDDMVATGRHTNPVATTRRGTRLRRPPERYSPS